MGRRARYSWRNPINGRRLYYSPRVLALQPPKSVDYREPRCSARYRCREPARASRCRKRSATRAGNSGSDEGNSGKPKTASASAARLTALSRRPGIRIIVIPTQQLHSLLEWSCEWRNLPVPTDHQPMTCEYLPQKSYNQLSCQNIRLLSPCITSRRTSPIYTTA